MPGLAVLAQPAILTAITALAGCLLVAARLNRPRWIGLTDRGLYLLAGDRDRYRTLKFIEWTDIDSVYLEKPLASRGTDAEKICLRAGRLTTRLCLQRVRLPAERALLLEHLRKRIDPQKVSQEAIEALEPALESSTYTELWLKELVDSSARSRLTPLRPGHSLHEGKYTILDRLGSGGQATVYRAERSVGTRPDTVILKEFVLPVFVEDTVRKAAIDRLISECSLLSTIDHPGIVKLLDTFIEDHRAYLVLEEAKGEPLDLLVERKGALPESEVIDLALQMCSILSYLQGLSPPVVHRDFTPDNLIVDPAGRVKLIDFSIAQELSHSSATAAAGKRNYMALEQFYGKAVPPSDIYALGATMYLLLTAREPSPLEPSLPRRVNPDVSPEIDALVAKATLLSLDERTGSANEVAQVLRQLKHR